MKGRRSKHVVVQVGYKGGKEGGREKGGLEEKRGWGCVRSPKIGEFTIQPVGVYTTQTTSSLCGDSFIILSFHYREPV